MGDHGHRDDEEWPVLKHDPSPYLTTDKVNPARGWSMWGRDERLKSGKRIEKKEASIPTAAGRAAGNTQTTTG